MKAVTKDADLIAKLDRMIASMETNKSLYQSIFKIKDEPSYLAALGKIDDATGLTAEAKLALKDFAASRNTYRSLSTKQFLDAMEREGALADLRVAYARRAELLAQKTLSPPEAKELADLEQKISASTKNFVAIEIKQGLTGQKAFNHIPSSGARVLADEPVGTYIMGSYLVDLKFILEELGYPVDKVGDFTFTLPNGQRFNMLNVSHDLYKTISTDGGFFTTVNGPWIDSAVQRGMKIIVVTEPSEATLYVTTFANGSFKTELTGFGKEMQRLEWTHGYRFDPVSKTMVPGSQLSDQAKTFTTITDQ